MTRIDIPAGVRASQLWGGTADVDVNGVANNPNLVRVQLPAEYERDWTVHLPAPIFTTGAALIATGAGAGLGPSVDNIDVFIEYGGAMGFTQTIKVDYPTRGKTIGVRGSTVNVFTQQHARGAILKDPCRIYAELVDAPPPSLTREALPLFTGDEFLMAIAPGPPATNVIPIPPRACEVALLFRPSTVPIGGLLTYRLSANSASLSETIDDFSTVAGGTYVNVAQSSHAELRWVTIPQTAQGLLLSNGAVGGGIAPSIIPIFRIAP